MLGSYLGHKCPALALWDIWKEWVNETVCNQFIYFLNFLSWLIPHNQCYIRAFYYHWANKCRNSNLDYTYFRWLSICLAWFSILLENENFGNPENQPKWLASSLIPKKLFDKNGCNQHLRLVEPIVMVYFIFNDNQV